MQYFILKEAVATKETGPEYPQIQKWKPGYNDDKSDSIFSYWEASNRGQVFPHFEPNLDAMVLHGKAKPTDLISGGTSVGLLISQKLKNIFKEFNFPPHRFYPAIILHKNTALGPYYLMHMISKYFEDYLDFVEYGKSNFLIEAVDGRPIESIRLHSKQEYLDVSAKLQEQTSKEKTFYAVSAHLIRFNNGFDKNLDCFRAPFGIDYYISQKLKNALVKDNITGFNITRANNIIV